MRSPYANILQAGNYYIYLNHENTVCGLLKCLDDNSVIHDPKTRQNESSTARMAYIREKHHAMNQKRSELRREAKLNGR